jgi:hypothetical protein
LEQNISRITTTPVWLLWLVIMSPALIWSAWLLVHGASKTAPPEWLIIPFVVSPVLYWLLVMLGRKETASENAEVAAGDGTEPSKPQPPVRPINHTKPRRA